MMLPDLIEKLEALRDEIQNDLGAHAVEQTEIRLATNPAWSMQHAISDAVPPVWVVEEETDNNEQQVVAYLADGGQVDRAPYLPKRVADLLGWIS